MQMLHGAYNIQNYHEIEEMKDLWTFVEGSEYDDMKLRKLEEPKYMVVGRCVLY